MPSWKEPTDKMILSVFKKHGLPYSEDSYSEYLWTGKHVNLNLVYRFDLNEAMGDAYHEVAHYMLASKTARKFPDFGLGNAPESSGYKKRKFSYDFVDKQEFQCTALEFDLMLEDGAPKNYLLFMLKTRCWHYSDIKTFKKIYIQACKRSRRDISLERLNTLTSILKTIIR